MEIAYVVLLVGVYFIGYFTRTVVDSIRRALTILSDRLQGSVSIKDELDEPKSTIVEPLSPEQEARQAMEARMRQINQ